MKLIHTKTLDLHDFYSSQIPPYAILSHTWGPEEVIYQDMPLAPSSLAAPHSAAAVGMSTAINPPPGSPPIGAAPSSPPSSAIPSSAASPPPASTPVASPASRKRGYAKILQTCRLARAQGLDYAWVDTCCIDKSSSAELTESINSMFEWYRLAAVCFVFLEDLAPEEPLAEKRKGKERWSLTTSPPPKTDRLSKVVSPDRASKAPSPSPSKPVEQRLRKCRWFTRGWTLQELLAPLKLEFYNSKWSYVGSKLDFVDSIAAITRIPVAALQRRVDLAGFSIAARMSWAARRETTRVEDLAYCLLGLFDVNMPLIYGEGPKAFRRLQEEIIKRRNDLTIFAWDDPLPVPATMPMSPGTSGKQKEQQQQQQQQQQDVASRPYQGIFAPMPLAFAHSTMYPFPDDFPEFSVTNKGLFVSDIPLRVVRVPHPDGSGGHLTLYAVVVGTDTSSPGRKDHGGIYLRKLGPTLFCRDGRFPLARFLRDGTSNLGMVEMKNFYILLDPPAPQAVPTAVFRNGAVHIPRDDTFELIDRAPMTLWDVTDRVFLRPKPYAWYRYSMALAMSFRAILGVGSASQRVNLVVLLDCRRDQALCRIFRQETFPKQSLMIFKGRHREESIMWSDLARDEPEILSVTDVVDVVSSQGVWRVKVALETSMVDGIASTLPMAKLKWEVKQLPAGTVIPEKTADPQAQTGMSSPPQSPPMGSISGKFPYRSKD